jgi:hypothetical protein
MILGIVEDSIGCVSRKKSSCVLVDFVDENGAPSLVSAYGSASFALDVENWSSFYCKFVPSEQGGKGVRKTSGSSFVGKFARKDSTQSPDSSPRSGNRGFLRSSSSEQVSPRSIGSSPRLETTHTIRNWESLLDRCTHLILFCKSNECAWLEKELERHSSKCVVSIVHEENID